MVIVLLLAGCTPAGSDHRAVFAVFGTEVEVQLRAASEPQAENAFRDIGALLQRLHGELHPWEAGELMALNRALAAGRARETTRDIAALIDAARTLEPASRGTFNPAIGALVNLWGFHTSHYPLTTPPPDGALIDALVAEQPSTLDLAVDGRQVKSNNPAVRLDFSGLAKGFAVERACGIVVDQGIDSAMINAGGDVMICAAANRPWRVAIRDPGGDVLDTLEIDRPLAVFTSGNYHRYGEFDGERYAHILDPATGRPVDEIVQATVVDPDPLLADAAATALVVAGPERWREVAASLGPEHAVIIDAEGAVNRLDQGSR